MKQWTRVAALLGVALLLSTHAIAVEAAEMERKKEALTSSRLKAGDSYRVQARFDVLPDSLRWVPVAGGITAPLTSQATRASPALKMFIAPPTSAFS